MKKIIYTAMLCLTALLCAPSVAAQSATPSQKAMTKKMKKEMERQADSIQHLKILDAINDRYFIITANSVRFRNGREFNSLNSSTNYLVVQNDGAIVQTAVSPSSLGANGLGGFTLPGRVGNITTTIDKKGNVSVVFHVDGLQSNVDVQISIPHNGRVATAYVTATMSNASFTITGEIIPFRDDSLKIDK